MTQLSTGDWFDLRGVYAIRAFDSDRKENGPRVALSFHLDRLNTFIVECATYEEAKLLRDEIAGLVNTTVSVSFKERVQKRLIEKSEIFEELKRRLNEKDIVK